MGGRAIQDYRTLEVEEDWRGADVSGKASMEEVGLSMGLRDGWVWDVLPGHPIYQGRGPCLFWTRAADFPASHLSWALREDAWGLL